jgi:glycosyltransferase involved in cell wall biosynthesis
MTGRPKVLQVVLSLNPGGTERLVLELALRLHAVAPTAVCCLDEPGDWAGELRERHIEITTLGRQPGFHPMLGAGIAAAAHRHGASVIHAHHYSPFVYSSLARCRRPGLGLVFTEHGRLSDTPPSTKRRLVNQVLSRFPHRVFTVSEDLKQHLVGEGFSDANVSVIYNGIDIGPLPTDAERHEVRRELAAPDDALVIGTIARLDPVKELGTMIQAAAMLGRPTALWIVGDGPERARLEAMRGQLGQDCDIRFLGQREDARRLLAGCDIYVNSSVSEGVSLTILEAMAAGLPVVATRVGGTPEVLDDSCGRLVPARDVTALAEALGDLAGRADERTRLGLAARERAQARFTLDRMVGEYHDVYREIGRARSAGPERQAERV